MHIAETTVDVRYAETDQMGVVYHANYLIWMELGRTKLINDLGFDYVEMEQDGVVSPVIDLSVSYKKAVTYGQTATIKTWVEKYDGLRVTYGYEIFDQGQNLAVTGQTVHIIVKKENFRPLSLRKAYPAWHEAYEKAKK